jgi:transaldolase
MNADATTRADPVAEVSAAGVSIWLDDLDRERITSGDLAALVRERHVVGVTTNPTIFKKALARASAYDLQVRDLALRGVAVEEAARAVTAWDVRTACDVLRPVFDATGGRDGRVSIEVDPRLALEAERTVAEARALWWLVDRPNLFIKVPATREGVRAIPQLLAEGISVNLTLIFSVARYRAVVDAFLDGLEERLRRGATLEGLESVASFFVSRVDTEVDRRLDAITDRDPARAQAARNLRGAAAIANARLAYEAFEESLATDRWRALAERGARPQRPLWASTGVKDPAYDDTRYVVELLGPETVNTMPELTLSALADHGQPRRGTARAGRAEAAAVMEGLARVGVDLDEVTEILEREGLEKFVADWDGLLGSLAGRLSTVDGSAFTRRPAG